MSVFTTDQIESLDAFQNTDDCQDWLSYEPQFEWTEDDLAEFDYEEKVAEMERQAMAAWWEMEGVRCATFGRDPTRNPYL